MATSVGSVNFDLLYGTVPAPVQTIEILEYGGVSGHGARYGPWRAPEAELIGIAYVADDDDAEELIADARALRNAFVTIEDSWGNTFSDVQILDASEMPVRGHRYAAVLKDGDTAVEVNIRFTVKQQYT
jgi:hypothetical protein